MAAQDLSEDLSVPQSRTYQYRKVMKPMLERKRRARINRCLDELKELLVGALQAEGESVSRLEKADVLELTVRHLHKLRRSQQISENSAGERFRQGFVHCANEVSKYISTVVSSASGPTLEMSVSTRLVSHLDQCIRSIETSQLQQHQQIMHPTQQLGPPTIPQGSPRASSQLSPCYPVSMGVTSAGGGGGLNILTSYTPPSSPVSSSSSPSSTSNAGNVAGHPHTKAYNYAPRSLGGSSASSTGSLSPIPPAHYNPMSIYAARNSGSQPLSLCIKSPINNPDEPFDLSNPVWRPW